MGRPIRSLTYYLTEACNLRCTYCYVEKRPKRSNPEVGRRVIDFLIRESREEPDLHLRFFGGEPMLEMKLIEEVVNYGRSRAGEAGKTIRFDMISNSTLAAPKTVERLAKLGVRVMSSVDGSRETMEHNRPFFSVSETFEGFDARLGRLVSSGVSSTARMTVAPDCKDVARDIKSLLPYGHRSILLATANNAAWTEEKLDEIYGGIADLYIEEARQGRLLPLSVTNELLVNRHEVANDAYLPPTQGFCEAGKDMLGVNVQGELYPCHRFAQMGKEFQLGTLEGGLDEEKRQIYEEVTTDTLHHEKCRTCPALPYCPGSCMAANFLEGGDLFYPESRHCHDLRAHVAAVERIYTTLIAEECRPFLEFLEDEWAFKRRKRLLDVLEESDSSGGQADLGAGEEHRDAL